MRYKLDDYVILDARLIGARHGHYLQININYLHGANTAPSRESLYVDTMQ